MGGSARKPGLMFCDGQSGLEHGVRLQAIGQGTNERSHGRVPEMFETESKHLGPGLIGGPVIEGNAVGGDEYAGAVLAKFAMDKNFLRRGFAEQSEELGELRGSGIRKAANRNGNKMNAEKFGASAFLVARVRRFAA